MNLKKKILFLTVNNLTTNPRLLKEVQLAERKYSCTVYAFWLNNWSDPIDRQYHEKLTNITFRYIYAGRKLLLPWLLSSFVEKVSKKIYPFFRYSLMLNAYGHSKRSFLLYRKIIKETEKYDFVVAHNLATFYPAYMFAKKNNIPFGFDIEDYHPGEKIDTDSANEIKRREFLLKRLIPHTFYISYASPLIGEYSMNLVSTPSSVKQIFVPNCFSMNEFEEPSNKFSSDRLRLVWYSQYITSNRGLEEIIEAAKPLREKLEIHLIGEMKPFFRNMLHGLGDFIFIHPPVNQIKLHKDISFYDVGLALEISSIDINKDIAVSNKIFGYAQSGLFILATNTKGHQWFLEQYPWSGIPTKQSIEDIRSKLEILISDKDLIRKNALVRFIKGKILAWENISEELLKLWGTCE